MVAHAFDHGLRAAVADTKPFGGPAPEESFSARGAVQDDVSHDDVLFGDEAAADRRINDHPSPRKSLADVIVGVSFQFHGDPAGQERAEALAGRPVHFEMDRIVGQPRFAVTLDQLMAEDRAHGPVRVDDLQFRPHRLALLQGGPSQFEQAGHVERFFEAVVLFPRAVDLDTLVRPGRWAEQPRQVQPVRLPVVDGPVGIQAIDAADHFVHGPKAQLGHDLSSFLGDQEQVIHHVLGLAGKLFPQIGVLRGDPDGAGIQMALPHHDAAHGDQRRGAKAKLFRPQHGGDHHVPAGLQPAVRLQHDATAQIVQHQGLMRFGDAQFPRQPRVLDTGQRRRPGPPPVTRDQDMVRKALGDARGNRADADFRNQLDADPRLRIGILQVVDQLFEIFDGIDVVVRRRADQAHAGGRIADPRDVFVHLAARQFAPFTRLGSLRDLDLQFVGVGQVPDRDAKPSGGDLFDGGTFAVAVCQHLETCRVLTPLPRVALPPQAVHGDGQRFMRFGGNGPEAHRPRTKPLDNLLSRLDLLQGDGPAVGLVSKCQQAPQSAAGLRVVVAVFSKACVGLAAFGPRGHLQVGNGGRVPHVPFPFGPPMEFARVGQQGLTFGWLLGVTQGVTPQGLLGQHVEVDTLNPAGGAGKAAMDDFVAEPHRLENLGPLVRVQRGDAHLGHHLQHPLGDRLAVGGHQVVVLAGHRVVFFAVAARVDGRMEVPFAPFVLAAHIFGLLNQPLAAALPQRLERQIRIDRIGPVADQQAVVVDLPGLARFQHQADPRPFGLADQVVVDGPAGQQGAERHAVAIDLAVREDQQRIAVVDGLFGLLADALQRGGHARFALGPRPGDVDRLGPPAAPGRVPVDMLESRQLLVGEDRMGNPQSMSVRGRGLQQIPLRANVAFQRHHDLFADRVDGRVGDLSEQLLEVVVQHPRLVREAGQGGVVAHRTDRVPQLLDHGQQHELHRFDRVAEGLHPFQQRVAG